MNRRTNSASVLIAFCLVLNLSVWPASASAETASFTCPGTSQTLYSSPGPTNEPHLVAFDGLIVAGPCVGIPASIRSVRSAAQGQGISSCNVLPQSPSVILILEWNDGTQSTAQSLFSTTTRPLGQVIRTATYVITSGRFVNATIVSTITLANTQFQACSQPEGVRDVVGPVTFTVTSAL